MNKIFRLFAVLLLLLAIGNNSYAQETISISDTLNNEWAFGWVAGLNGTQSSYNHWSKGGQDNIAVNGYSLLSGAYKKDRFEYGFVLNMRYGITKIEDEGTRKSDDRLAMRHRAAYILNDENTMNAFADVSISTQFDAGYKYNSDGTKTLISDFISPLYFTESIGYAYTPKDYISFEAGLGLKQTYVKDDDLVSFFGIDPGDNLSSEGGLVLGISFKKDIMENVNYTSRFETFTNFKKTLESTDVAWANQLTGKINKYLNATFQFEMLYDDDITKDLQTKQVLAAGVLVNIF